MPWSRAPTSQTNWTVCVAGAAEERRRSLGTERSLGRRNSCRRSPGFGVPTGTARQSARFGVGTAGAGRPRYCVPVGTDVATDPTNQAVPFAVSVQYQ